VRGEHGLGLDRLKPIERGERELAIVVEGVKPDSALPGYVVEGRERIAREQHAALR
jgi:hypothetical protein